MNIPEGFEIKEQTEDRIVLMPKSEWISVDDRLPESGVQVVLLADRWWNTPDDVPEARVTATGYLSDFNSPKPYWCIFGERAMQLNDFPHWMPLPEPPVDKKGGSN